MGLQNKTARKHRSKYKKRKKNICSRRLTFIVRLNVGNFDLELLRLPHGRREMRNNTPRSLRKIRMSKWTEDREDSVARLFLMGEQSSENLLFSLFDIFADFSENLHFELLEISGMVVSRRLAFVCLASNVRGSRTRSSAAAWSCCRQSGGSFHCSFLGQSAGWIRILILVHLLASLSEFRGHFRHQVHCWRCTGRRAGLACSTRTVPVGSREIQPWCRRRRRWRWWGRRRWSRWRCATCARHDQMQRWCGGYRTVAFVDRMIGVRRRRRVGIRNQCVVGFFFFHRLVVVSVTDRRIRGSGIWTQLVRVRRGRMLLLLLMMLWLCRRGRRRRRRRRRRRSRCGIDRYCRRCWRKRRRRLTGLTFVRWRYPIIVGIQCRRWKSCSTISRARRRYISSTIDTFENSRHRTAELLRVKLRGEIQPVDTRLIAPLMEGRRGLIVFDSLTDRVVEHHFVVLNLSTHDPVALRVRREEQLNLRRAIRCAVNPLLLRVIVDHGRGFTTGQNLFFGIISYHSRFARLR